jgi:DNA repair exonuclease SbcCD ATPase subunit
MIVLNDQGTINTIYHISDIHIRTSDERYEEYNCIFTKFCQEITDPDNSVIVVTGDILHSKTQLTPICVRELIDFLVMMTNTADVIITLGNHDLPANNVIDDNIVNIISRKNFETKHKLYVLTYNDTYSYKNVIFGNTLVHSTYVTPCKTNDDKIKIALYHGTINGSKKSVNDVNTDSVIKITDFSEYDIGLFGDIHVHQFMDENKKFAYAGSMIQQNFDEEFENHGYIKWNLTTRTAEFIPIQNEYGYVTFNLDSHDSKHTDIINQQAISQINHLRAKLVCTNMSQQEINLAEVNLRSKFDLVECVITRENNVTQQIQQDQHDIQKQTQPIECIENNEDIIKIFNDAIIKVYPDNTETQNKLLSKYVSDELQLLGHSFTNEYKRIRLDELKFKNLFAYGTGNSINFKNMSGIVGLVAPNFTGKSSIIDAILFSLYEKSSRGIRTQCVNVAKTTFSSQLSVNVNDNDYIISRQGHRSEGSTTASVDIKKNNVLVECNDKTHYNNYIIENICPYDVFVDNTVILQTSTGYIDYTEEERKKILFRIMNLDVLHKLYKKFKSQIAHTKFYTTKLKKDLEIAINECEKYEQPQNIIQKQLDIMIELENLHSDKDLLERLFMDHQKTQDCNSDAYTEEEYQHASTSFVVIKNEIVSYNDKIKILHEKLNEINEKLQQYDTEKINDIFTQFCEKRDCEIENLRDYLRILNVTVGEYTIEQCDDRLQYIDIKLQKINAHIKMYPSDMCDVINNVTDSINKLQQLRMEKKSVIAELNNYMQKQEKLKDYEFNPDCEFCLKNSLTQEKQFIDSMVSSLESKLNEIRESINKINTSFEMYKINIFDAINQHCEQNEMKSLSEFIHEYNDLVEKKSDLLYGKWKLIKIKEKINCIEHIHELKKKKCVEYEIFTSLQVKQIELEKENIICENQLLGFKTAERDALHIIKSYEEYLSNKQYYDIRENLQMALTESSRKIKVCEEKLMRIETQLLESEHAYKTKQICSQQIDEHEQIINSYTMLLDIYKKHGIIDKIVCDRIVPELELGVNDLLRTVTDFQIKITYGSAETSVESGMHCSDSRITIERICAGGTNQRINAKLLSGFEHDILNLIFKIKFNQMNVFMKTDFLILDEVLSSADETHLNKLEHLFSYIKEHYKWCMLITHLNAMKNYFTQTITIDRNDGISKIVVK